jgi:hypothetical protein
MHKNLLMLIVMGLVAAMPLAAMAAVNWDGGGDGVTWADPLNWGGSLPHNEYFTEEARVDYVHTPVIDETNGFTAWDRCRIKGGTVTQTGGSHRWTNYTDPSWSGFALHRDTATLNMTGGSMYADKVNLGFDLFDQEPIAANIDGVGIVNVWGNATFVVEVNTYNDPTSTLFGTFHLWIADGSYIDIRDDGVLRVPALIQSEVDDFITAGKIVAGTPGDSLYNVIVGDEYVIYASDQPPIPGDANRDLQVDDTDATILASNWLGTNKGWGEGDFNYDGVVNEEDASMLAANMGVGVPAAASVPEPGTLLLICLGLVSLVLIRARQ